jgi:Carboxypeptidase regulatory-like domain
MRHLLLSVLLLTSSIVFATTPVKATDPAGLVKLPVRRVVLYKNGVGYFEHAGRINGDQELGIHFTTAQLNDVLKSLTVVDLGEGRVTGIRYDSIAPLDVRLRGLRLPLGEQPTQTDFLNALRGSRVEVRNGLITVVGRVLSIEKKTHTAPKSDELIETSELSLVTDAGELRTFTLSAAASVRVVEKELSQDVNRYLNLLESARSNDLRRMVISDSGKGERDLFVSYISEVPIWKSTYRIVLRKNAKPLLQGWAIVDNTVGEDWSNVQLTLVAGSPQSFVQDISRPLYARRPVVGLPHAAMLVPQSHEGTLDGKDAGFAMAAPGPPPMSAPSNGFGSGGGVGSGHAGGIGGGIFRLGGGVTGRAGVLQGTVTDQSGAVVANADVTYQASNGRSESTRTDANGRYRFYNVPIGGVTLSINSPGFRQYRASTDMPAGGGKSISNRLIVGAMTESVMVSAESGPIETSSVADAIENLEAEATGGEIGDLFQYDLKQRISIGKDQSALVPIINAHIDAEKVTLWNSESQRALRALWITNSSGLTLDSGTFNIVEDGAFSGEGLLQSVKPAERRLISYAADSAVRVTPRDESRLEPATRVRVFKGVMWVTREERATREYVVHNSDTSAREVVVEHPVRQGWKLVDGLKPEETTASFYRFVVKVEPNATAKLEVKEFRPDTSTVALSTLTPDQVTYFSTQRTITPELEQAMRRILLKKAEIGGLETDMRARQQEVDTITADQGRVRENMKALKGTAEEKALVQRYTHQLDSQEDRLNALREQIADLKQKRDSAGAELDHMIMDVSFEQGN